MNNTVDVVKNLSHVTQATQHNHKQAYICATMKTDNNP